MIFLWFATAPKLEIVVSFVREIDGDAWKLQCWGFGLIVCRGPLLGLVVGGAIVQNLLVTTSYVVLTSVLGELSLFLWSISGTCVVF